MRYIVVRRRMWACWVRLHILALRSEVRHATCTLLHLRERCRNWRVELRVSEAGWRMACDASRGLWVLKGRFHECGRGCELSGS